MKFSTNKQLWERFNDRVDKSQGPLGCWLWTGAKEYQGYGYFHYEHKKPPIRAHRLSFKLMYGDMLLEKPNICHKCDNRACVNPLHLFLGTHQENVKDRTIKGRGVRGSKQWASKLTEKDVLEIRKLLTQNVNTLEIAKKFNVSRSNIQKIASREYWGWLHE